MVTSLFQHFPLFVPPREFAQGGSGGAIFHAGTVEYLIISGFEENLSGVNGPAIMSVGALRNITELEFSGNAYYCSDDTYLSEVLSVLGQL